MAEFKQKLKHQILNECCMDKLLQKFTFEQVALTFNVPIEYVKKVDRIQRVILEQEYFNSDDEMKIGRRGSWTLSNPRNYMKSNFLLESQNKKK